MNKLIPGAKIWVLDDEGAPSYVIDADICLETAEESAITNKNRGMNRATTKIKRVTMNQGRINRVNARIKRVIIDIPESIGCFDLSKGTEFYVDSDGLIVQFEKIESLDGPEERRKWRKGK